MTDNKSFGERIRSIRYRRGETAKEFGDNFNPPFTKSTISKWENGYYLPNKTRLKEIAELGGVSVEYLINGKDTELEKLRDMKSKLEYINKDYHAQLISSDTVALLVKRLLKEM